MIKKIRITNHNERAVEDTTIGKVYDVTFHAKSSRDDWGHICRKDTLCFIDDKGDKVSIWTCDPIYEVIDEEGYTPEPPESTQVESSEVEATIPEFDWGGVDDDVEAVVLYPDSPPDFYKYIDGKLYVQFSRDERYFRSDYDAVSEIFGDYDEGRVLIKPLTVEPPSISTILQEAQQAILEHHRVTGKVSFTVTCNE